MTEVVLRHPLLAARGARHAFGTRHAPPPPPGLVLARQVHGARAVRVGARAAAPGEADALVAVTPGLAVGVVTADCVPVLLSDAGARRVAAVHAGWRGLAAGVIPAAVDALLAAGCAPEDLAAVVGPHIGACCYEVDEPVLDALAPRFGAALEAATAPTRPGHVRLDLLSLAHVELARTLGGGASGSVAGCTSCEEERFHSYRRDGPRAGRLVHWIVTAAAAT